MKLRNKKTGEIIEKCFSDCFVVNTGSQVLTYHSLAELNEEWEDYKPAEPLIKDEKTRKAVRVWFNANNFGCRSLQYYKDGYSRSHFVHAKGNTMKIFFREEISNLKDGNFYGIDDLCGEEEE